MKRAKLKRAPLKEAIFELFWQSPLDSTGIPYDSGFDLAQGKFQDKISKKFPVYRKTAFNNPSLKVYGQPVHQFWKNESEWPVIQLGPGVVTVNDTDKNYNWTATYRKNIHEAIENLISSYKDELNFERISLRYIDSYDLPGGNSNPLDFINKNFKTQIENSYKLPGKMIGVNINQGFQVLNDSIVTLNIQTVKNNVNNSDAIAWITHIQKIGPITQEKIYQWIDDAHNICSDLFVETLNPTFYGIFNK